jgi:hypothetical protein
VITIERNGVKFGTDHQYMWVLCEEKGECDPPCNWRHFVRLERRWYVDGERTSHPYFKRYYAVATGRELP